MAATKSITEKVDSVFRTRSLGISARGIPDQYADGKAAKVWKSYIGDQQQRTKYYKEQLLQLLKMRNCLHILDVACGTGTRSLGIAARGIPDQYADGKAAQVWQKYIGDQQKRTSFYKEKLVKILNTRNTKTVLDVSCGTGVDSIMLLEEGFKVTSCDASDKMLKYALKTRWERRKEEAFDNWIIEEGNWLHLEDAAFEKPGEGFDAIICMGNSFSHLPDFDGDQKNHYEAITNFYNFLRPGGVLIIDHRNYDHIVKGGKAPTKNIYYQSKTDIDIKTSVLMVDGKYHMVTLDYTVHDDDVPQNSEPQESKFRLSYYPHLLAKFNQIITDVFGEDIKHTVLADFEPMDQVENPAYYIHICEKK